jgi:hypothetical protein
MAEGPYDRAARPWDLLNRRLGRVDRQTAVQRLQLCQECPKLVRLTRQCTECGCFMPAKAKLPNASCPLGTWGQTAPTADDPAPAPVTTKPQVPEPQVPEPQRTEPQRMEAQRTEPQRTGATPAPLKNVAFVLDDEVVRTMEVDERFAAILLSNPVIVEVPQQAEDEAALKPGDYYFSDGTTCLTVRRGHPALRPRRPPPRPQKELVGCEGNPLVCSHVLRAELVVALPRTVADALTITGR